MITCSLSGLIYIQWRSAGVWVSHNRVWRESQNNSRNINDDSESLSPFIIKNQIFSDEWSEANTCIRLHASRINDWKMYTLCIYINLFKTKIYCVLFKNEWENRMCKTKSKNKIWTLNIYFWIHFVSANFHSLTIIDFVKIWNRTESRPEWFCTSKVVFSSVHWRTHCILTHKRWGKTNPRRHWTDTLCTSHWPLPLNNTSATCPPQSKHRNVSSQHSIHLSTCRRSNINWP